MKLTEKEVDKIIKLMRIAYSQRGLDEKNAQNKYGNNFDNWAKKLIEDNYTVYNMDIKITNLETNEVSFNQNYKSISKKDVDKHVKGITEDYFCVASNAGIESDNCPEYRCFTGVNTNTSQLVILTYWETS